MKKLLLRRQNLKFVSVLKMILGKTKFNDKKNTKQRRETAEKFYKLLASENIK